jgi:beta-glucosidase
VFGAPEHREIARSAVRKSLVLLKNEVSALPITSSNYQVVCVAGTKADDFGTQAGAWTVGWQGQVGNAHRSSDAHTILEGIRALAPSHGLRVVYSVDGRFAEGACQSGDRALTLAVVGEKPYAEYKGDNPEPRLSTEDLEMLAKARLNKGPLAVLLLSGRPLLVSEQLPSWQALIAAWLPGSQGEAVADVLFGDVGFQGQLPVTWVRDAAHLGTVAGSDMHGAGVLFPYGFGLTY